MKLKVSNVLFLAGTVMLLGSGTERRVTTQEHLSDLTVPNEWKPYLDPETDEFWTEGNHIPDKGFLLWAKKPTIENAKLFLIRMNMKRNLLHLLYDQQKQANIELIQAGIIADDYDFLSSAVNASMEKVSDLKHKLSDTHIFFLFNPSCKYSQRQAKVLSGLKNVSPMQVGGEILHNFSGLPEAVWAEKQDIEEHTKDGSVPVLLIYNNKTNKMTKLYGFQSLSTIVKIAGELRK